MIKISKKVEYGLISLLYMEERAAGKLTTARELSEHFHIPLEMMGKVMQALAKKKLIESCQGIKGGYRLHLPIKDIKLSAVVQALDGPISLVGCGNSPRKCNQAPFCNIKMPMKKIQKELAGFFDNITLHDLRTKYSN